MKDPTGICCTTSLFQSAREVNSREKKVIRQMPFLKKISQYVIGHKWGLTAAAPKCSLEQIFLCVLNSNYKLHLAMPNRLGRERRLICAYPQCHKLQGFYKDFFSTFQSCLIKTTAIDIIRGLTCNLINCFRSL